MAVAVGGGYTVVVSQNGDVYSSGEQYYHKAMGLGKPLSKEEGYKLNPVDAQYFSGSPVRHVAAGFNHTGIVTDAGELFMCGDGEYGRLGLGDEEDRTTPTLVPKENFGGDAVLMVACGMFHTVVVTMRGAVYTFGDNEHYQLGHGHTGDVMVPTQIHPQRLGNQRIVFAAAGANQTLLVSKNGYLFFCGILDGNTTVAYAYPLPLRPDDFGGEKIVFAAAGEQNMAAVTASGRLFTWGQNRHYDLGHGPTESEFVWDPKLVTIGSQELPVVMVACGNTHMLAVMSDGSVWACGNGDNYKLGLGDTNSQSTFQKVFQNFDGQRAVTAACGGDCSFVVTEDNTLWKWGSVNSDYFTREGSRVGTPYGSFIRPVRERGTGKLDLPIGRLRIDWPSRNSVLAFVMGTHARLNQNSPLRALSGEVELSRMILDNLKEVHWVPGEAGRLQGMLRLLGSLPYKARLTKEKNGFWNVIHPHITQTKMVCV